MHYKNYKIIYIEPLLAHKIIQELLKVSITINHIHVLVLVGKLDNNQQNYSLKSDGVIEVFKHLQK